MISKSLRAWNLQQNKFPSVFLYQNTPSGVFSISNVESEIHEKLTPLERLTIGLALEMKKITRIEIHVISGISIDICDEILEEIKYQGLVENIEYDNNQLNLNLKRLERELGSDWFTPQIKSLIQKKLIKQYQISESGRLALESDSKIIRETRNLNLIITGDPFYLFYDILELRSEGYELIDVSASLIKQILHHAENFTQYTGIKPITIGSNSVFDGKEVSSTLWISVEENGKSPTKYNAHLTSRTFDRWSRLKWNQYLQNHIPKFIKIETLIINSLSETFSMVEDVISEGLTLNEDKITWSLKTDVEMQMLIFDYSSDPIAETISEVKLRYPDSRWKVIILLQLEPYDELSEISLKSGRFHQNASRKGFSLGDGYVLWNKLMAEWGKETEYNEFLKTIENLVKYDCLIERLPQIEKVIVDVDDILSKDRRGRQKWHFNRLRVLLDILKEGEVNNFVMLSSNKIKTKIDEEDELYQWIEDGKIIIYDSDKKSENPLNVARKAKIHYLGDKQMTIKRSKKSYGRTLEFTIDGNNITISGLQPFYDWRMESIFRKMYDVFYE